MAEELDRDDRQASLGLQGGLFGFEYDLCPGEFRDDDDWFLSSEKNPELPVAGSFNVGGHASGLRFGQDSGHVAPCVRTHCPILMVLLLNCLVARSCRSVAGILDGNLDDISQDE